MINRVSDNEYYDYRKLSPPTSADTTGDNEKFSLGYQRTDDKKDEDEIEERISEKGMDKNLGKNDSRAMVRGGVKLELSENARKEAVEGNRAIFADLLNRVRTFVNAFVCSCRELFNRIWNDPVPDEEVLPVEEVPSEETDRLSEEYRNIHNEQDMPAEREVRTEKDIQKYLRSGNLEQVISILTEDGSRTIAKNSSLLTYYDRTGRITPISASDQERILYGDRNVKKL